MPDPEILDFLQQRRRQNAGVSADPLDATWDGLAAHQRAGLALVATSDSDPDQAGRANTLGRQAGLPADVVERNMPEVQSRLRNRDAQPILIGNPKLAAWASEPRHAAVASDDLSTLDRIGQGVSSFLGHIAGNIDRALLSDVGVQDIVPRVPTVIRKAPAALGSGIASMTSGALGYVRGAEENAERLDPTAGLQRRVFGNTIEGKIASMSASAARSADAAAGRTMPKTGDWLTDQMLSAVSNVPASVVALSAGLTAKAAGLAAEGASAVGALSGGVIQGGQSYNDARAQGVAPGKAFAYANADLATETAGEYLGELPFLRATGAGSSATRRFLRSQVGEQVGEQFSTVAQDFSAWVALPSNKAKTFGDYLSQLPDHMLDTAVQTFVGSAITQVGVTGTEKALGLAGSRARQAVRGRAASGAVDAIMAQAAKSKTRERDKDGFETYVAAHTDGGPLEHLFVPGSRLPSFLGAC